MLNIRTKKKPNLGSFFYNRTKLGKRASAAVKEAREHKDFILSPEMERATTPFDIIDIIGRTDKCALEEVCYIPHTLQMMMLHKFQRLGYFNWPPMNLQGLQKIPKPPAVVNQREYNSLLHETGQTIVNVADGRKIVFVIFSAGDTGGSGEGPWYCKSALFTYMLLLRLQIPGLTHCPLLVLGTDADIDKILEELKSRDRSRKTLSDYFFAQVLDGVYSGQEATQMLQLWWHSVMRFNTDINLRSLKPLYGLFTPIVELPSASYQGREIIVGDKKFITDSESEYDYVEDGVLYAEKSVPSSRVPDAKTNSFLLPFKISQTIGDRSYEILEEDNRDFIPPYRQHPMCHKQKSGHKRIQTSIHFMSRNDRDDGNDSDDSNDNFYVQQLQQKISPAGEREFLFRKSLKASHRQKKPRELERKSKEREKKVKKKDMKKDERKMSWTKRLSSFFS